MAVEFTLTPSQQVIQNNFAHLVANIQLDSLFPYLVQHGLLTEELRQLYCLPSVTRTEKKQRILDALVYQKNTLPALIQCLRESADGEEYGGLWEQIRLADNLEIQLLQQVEDAKRRQSPVRDEPREPLEPPTLPSQGSPSPGNARALFEEAMQSGYVLCNMVILLLIGVAGSGKTSFLRLVMDKPPPVIRESTPLAQSAIRAVSISMATVSSEGLVWRGVSPGDLLQMLADAIKGKMLLHFTTPLSASPVKPMPRPGVVKRILNWISKPKAAAAECPDNKHADDLENEHSDVLLAVKSKPSSSKLAKSKPVQEMLSHLEAAELGCEELFSENWVYLVDSGGQPQYHELIPTFIRHVSGAVLFVKLNEDLGSHPTIAYYAQGGKLCGRTYSSPLTNEQTIKNCLQTIQSRLNVTGGHDCPAIFFVGTHRDLESASESIESKDEQLLDMLKSLEGLKQHVVFNRVAKPEKLMSVVNAKDPEAQDHHTVGEFRKAVMRGCKKVELKVPISWFILEQQLQELAKKNATLILSLEECLAVARDLEMDQPRLLAAINYFVRLNLFKYFPTVLPSVVFTTSQVLLDKISELVMHSHYLHGEPGCEPEPIQIENDINLLRFRDNAIVNHPFLQNFQAHYRYEGGLFTPQELLNVLSNQLVFAPFLGEDFFMPCVLPQLPMEEVATFRLPSGSPVAPMLIHYAGGLFPTGLFSSLVAFLQDRSPWKVAEKHGEPISLFKNCVMFKHTDFPITLTLIYSFEFIEIHAKVEHGFSASPYPSIRTTLFLGLDRAATIQGYDSLRPQIGFLCVCEKGASHLASVSDDGRWWCCSLDDTCNGALTENQLVWFGDFDTSTNAKKGDACPISKSASRDHSEQSEILHSLPQRGKLNPADAKAKFNIPGAQLVSKGTLIIERSQQLQTLEWEKHGLKIHVPPGALPESEDTCEIEVATTFSGSFVLPLDHTLVSPIFYIQPNMELNKPLMIEMEHCCLTETENDAKSLVPIFAPSSHRKPPYIFQPLSDGARTFAVGSFWGNFEVSTFSWFALSWFRAALSWFREPPAVYSGRMYYRPEDRNRWFIVKLIVYPSLTECCEAVEKRYSPQNKWIEMMSSFSMRFLSSTQDFSLLFDESVVKEGWEIAPCRIPLTISREDIHNPKSTDYYDPASCELSVEWTKKDEQPQNLRYYIDVQGVNIDRLLIALNPNKIATEKDDACTINTSDSRDCCEQLEVLHSPPQRDPTLTISDVSGALEDLVDWHRLGIQLEIKKSKLSVIEHDYRGLLRQRDEMIDLWLRSDRSASWDKLCTALDNMDERTMAASIRSKYCT